MADRYWVGGTASWDGTAGTKWALTSGGAGGESIPTTADDVYFDANSSGTVTIAAGNTGAKSIDCTGFTGQLTVGSAITVAGNLTLSSGMTISHTTNVITITGNATIITAGKTIGAMTINGSEIIVTLGDALNFGIRILTILSGTFNTSGFTLSGGVFRSQVNNTRTINFDSSVVTLGSSGVVFTFGNGANLTFNAGTSQINLTAAALTISGGSKTFHNVSFTSAGPFANARNISGANTFNNLTLNASADGLNQLSIDSDQTVNGTLTCAGSSFIKRGFVRSNTIGTTRTITAATVSATDCDFRDITIAGAAAPISPTRGGDCGGNSGITFPAAKNCFRVGTNTSWTGSSSWALTSGGAGSNDNFPLAQDTAVINEDTTLTGTLSSATYNIGSIDSSARTTGITLNFSASPNIYGVLIFGSGVTISGSGNAQNFNGRDTQFILTNGKTVTFNITIEKPSGAFELVDAFNSSGQITHFLGTFDAKIYNLTFTNFISPLGNVRTINMGSGLWTISGTGTQIWTVEATNLTLNKGTADILLSNTTTSARAFGRTGGAGISYNKLTIGGATGTSVLTLLSGTFAELASIKTVAHTVRFSVSNVVTIDTWSVTGTAGNLVTVDTGLSFRRTFALTNSTTGLIDYLSVKNIGVASPNRFFVGNNSIDGGNNLNVIFSSPPALDTGSMFFMFD